MERARKTKAEGVPIFYGPTRAHLMGRKGSPDTSDKQLATLAIRGYPIGGCDVHTIQGSKIDGNEAVWIERPRLKMGKLLKGLEPSFHHYK
ncbi:hypothetical protein Tco_1234903 [Tanacetum coccineum]